jgi:hypothetical protein
MLLRCLLSFIFGAFERSFEGTECSFEGFERKFGGFEYTFYPTADANATSFWCLKTHVSSICLKDNLFL